MRRLVAFLFVLALSTGCAGASVAIVAPGARFPISMSSGLRDINGARVLTEQHTPVGTFADEHWAWRTFYSKVGLDHDYDISEELNRQVDASRGNAVANLEVSSESCFLNKFFPLTLLPFWAGCEIVRLKGDIFRIDPPSTAAAAPQVESNEAKPEVIAVLRTGKLRIKACVEDQRERDLRNHGELTAEWTVGAEGEVISLKIGDPYQHLPVAACVSETIRSMVFPRSLAGQVLSVPTRF